MNDIHKQQYIETLNQLQVSDELHLSLLALEKTHTGSNHNTFRSRLKHITTAAAAVCLITAAAFLWNELPQNSLSSSEILENGENIDQAKAPDSATNNMLTSQAPDSTEDTTTGISSSNDAALKGAGDTNLDIDSKKNIAQASPDEDILSDTDQLNPGNRELTFDELTAIPVFQNYVPSQIPEGFTFESCVLSEGNTDQADNVFFIFTNGYQYIEILVQKDQSASPVDINKTERYDITQYEIPFADSVPEEYYETINNPVFLKEDFHEELLLFRAYEANETGDENLRINFGIKDNNNVVTYRFKGVDIQDAYSLILSSPYFK